MRDYFDPTSGLSDYLDGLSGAERVAFGTSPETDPVRTAATLAPSAPSLVYRGALAPVAVRAPVAPSGEPASAPWRRLAALAAGSISSAAVSAYTANPVYHATLAPMAVRLRNWGWLVLSPASVATQAAARAYLQGELDSLRLAPAGWLPVQAIRSSLEAALAAVGGTPSGTAPRPSGGSTGTPTMTVTPHAPGGGGAFDASRPTTPPPAGGGSTPSPDAAPGTTPECPANASPVPGGCGCNPGFAIDASGTACVPASVPATRPPASSSTGMGWLLLLGGALVVYRALK